MITFNSESSDLLIEVVDGSVNVLATIPLGEPFNLAPFAPAQPWEIGENRILITAISGEILEIIRVSGSGGFSFSILNENQWRSNLIGDPNHTATLVYEIQVSSGGGIEVIATYNRAYLVDSDIIQEFSNIPLMPPSGDGVSRINRSDFIIALLNIPFKIPDDMVDNEANIFIGGFDTRLPAGVLKSDKLYVDLGEIVVSDLKNNSLDYDSTEYLLILPFIETTVILPPHFVVNKAISVKYVIDAYSGDLTVNVYNGEDNPIISEISGVGREIPFKTYNTTHLELGSNRGSENGVLSAYIRKSFRKVLDSDFSNLISYQGSLTNLKGYLEVENIDLQLNATSMEKEQILSMLQSGVIIK